MLSNIKPKTEPIIQKLIKPLSFIHPNIFTILGLIPPILFLFFLVQENYFWALIMLILSIFDTLDGTIARMTGKVSSFGGVLDSSIDRISDGIYISAFGFASLVSWKLVILFLIGSYLVSYIRSRAELAGNGKFKLDVGIMERSERILFLIILTLVNLFNFNVQFEYLDMNEALFIIGILLTWVTVLQRLIMSYKKLKGT